MALCRKKEDEQRILTSQEEDKHVSQGVHNMDDQGPMLEENSEALLESPPDNEDPVVPKNVSNSENQSNVDDQGPLREENSEALLNSPPDNEVPIDPKNVSKSENQPVGVNYCNNCGKDLHPIAKCLPVKQGQGLRSSHSVAEAENVNEQAGAENDKEVEGNPQEDLENLELIKEIGRMAIEERLSKNEQSGSGAHETKPAKVEIEISCPSETNDVSFHTEQMPRGTDECFPDALLEYLEDILDNYLKLECKIPRYIQPSYLTTVQLDLISPQTRQDAVDWIIMIHQYLGLMQETLYLSVNAMDIYLTHERIERHNLKLVVLCAVVMAGKYEEMFFPSIDEIATLNGEEYKANQIISMEATMSDVLQHTFGLPTQFKFLNLFLKVSGAETLIRHMAYFLSQLCLTQYEMLKYPPSKLASAAIYCSQCAIYKNPQWNKDLQFYTGYNEEQLKECANLMAKFHKNSRSTLPGLYSKFSSRKFSCVAIKPPATIPE